MKKSNEYLLEKELGSSAASVVIGTLVTVKNILMLLKCYKTPHYPQSFRNIEVTNHTVTERLNGATGVPLSVFCLLKSPYNSFLSSTKTCIYKNSISVYNWSDNNVIVFPTHFKALRKCVHNCSCSLSLPAPLSCFTREIFGDKFYLLSPLQILLS